MDGISLFDSTNFTNKTAEVKRRKKTNLFRNFLIQNQTLLLLQQFQKDKAPIFQYLMMQENTSLITRELRRVHQITPVEIKIVIEEIKTGAIVDPATEIENETEIDETIKEHLDLTLISKKK